MYVCVCVCMFIIILIFVEHNKQTNHLTYDCILLIMLLCSF